MVFPIPIPPTPRRFGVTDPISLGIAHGGSGGNLPFFHGFIGSVYQPIGDDLGIFLWHWHVSWVYKVYTKCIIFFHFLVKLWCDQNNGHKFMGLIQPYRKSRCQ